ncbi:uncharacterized protein LOC132299617 isoform X3 [Cornus florida]|uniref:uncharacterized protein LOC132299617 isoform X3 n=1 Tax=Cornus florida TaxID=4283 RepID=UPI0028A1F7B3|nr:uncharacterized protein LOC132299617 isoform X3 [Cornus florida]
MATNLATTVNPVANHLFAAVDMGTNSFKLLIVRTDPATGKFMAIDRLKEPVVLGREIPASATISAASQLRAIEALSKFQQILHSHRISPTQTRLVATSAVREATNQTEFLHKIQQALGFEIDVLSGEEEARLAYVGVLQFYPVFNKTVLTIDIGGGSTEFVIGKEGKVIFGTSLKLGHVTLTEEFVKSNEISKLREHIRSSIRESGLIESVAELGFDVAIGSSGTIRWIEKAVFLGYGRNLMDNAGFFEGYRRDWSFNKEELSELVERLCDKDQGLEGKVRRDGFFKRRSEFIVAGAVLLEEIFGMLGIDEMEVSGYALGEGVIAENLAEVFDGYDLNANARWQSVLRVARRFNNKKRMKNGAVCVSIAKEIFEGVRKWNMLADHQNELPVSLDDKDLECLEAACLLHNIGLFGGKKGYHRQSSHIIMYGGHLHGYSTEEVELIALLVRHHRKKFPKLHGASLQRSAKEFQVKQKFRILCAILRISVLLQQYQSEIQPMEFSHSDEGFKLLGCYDYILQEPWRLDWEEIEQVLSKMKVEPLPAGLAQPLTEDVEEELRKDLEHFRQVFQQKLSVVVPLSTSESSEM